MAQASRASAHDRIRLAQQLILGLPREISAEGAEQMEVLVEYLYTFRAATLEQLARCLPGEMVTRVNYWLNRYPYIQKDMKSVEHYNATLHKWIRPRKIGVYTLTTEALIAYEIAMEYGEKGYTGKRKLDYKPRNLENALHAVELFTRVLGVNQGPSVQWITNQYAAKELRDQKVLEKGESLSTSGFISVDGVGMWGIGVYVKKTNSVFNNTKKTFSPQFFGVFDGIMLIRGEQLARAHEIAYHREGSKGARDDLYFRFVPYEFSLEHPKWFLGMLRKNRWAVLDALFESLRQRGGVVEQVQYSTDYAGSSHEAFRFRVTHAPDENGRRRVEYVDTSYGASVAEFISMLTPKSVVDAGDRTMYVVEPGEIEAYERIAQSKGLTGMQFRLIDWPGGK